MKVVKWLDLHFEECLLTVFLATLTVLISVNVVLRYVVGTGIAWSEAICRYCLVYSTFLTIAHWVRRGNGISVDFVVQLVPENVRKTLSLIVLILQLAFFACLFTRSIIVMRTVYWAGTVDGTLGFSMSYIYFACVLGFGDALIRSIQVLVLRIMNKNEEVA